MSAPGIEQLWRNAFCARLREVLARMRAGDDVPPGLRYRTEGFAEAGLVLELIDAVALGALLDAEYAQALGASTESLFGAGARTWIDPLQRRVELRLRMPRAPVFPGVQDD
jgi:hypothetical protein